MEVPLKYFLPAYLIAYFLAAFVWRSYLTWKRTGINPVVFKGSDDAHDFIGRIFKLVFAFVVAAVLAYSFWPKLYAYFSPIEWLEQPWLKWLGFGLLLLSLVWTVLAQAHMGQSWRIGIDREHPTTLVQNGVFGVSRNPIFLGMMITLLGLFLVIPNAVTLVTFVTGAVLIQIQVRLEEEFLRQTHGQDYSAYCRGVRRWF